MATQGKLGVRTSLQDLEGFKGRSSSPKKDHISQYTNQTHNVAITRQGKMTV